MEAKRETVLITGATSGIGNDFAHIFAERGYDLFLASRNREKMDSIKKKLEDLCGITVRMMSVDLAKPLSTRKVYEETISQKMDIHVLVNNAGVGVAGEHVDLDMRKVEEMIHLNVTTLTELCSLFGGAMKKKRKGYILNIASTAAYQPTPFTAVYGATKSYVLNFSEALAEELEDYNVVVSCLSPGPTDTNFFDGVGVEGVREKKKGIWAKSNLMKSRKVAEIGVNALFAKKLSVIAGNWNSFLAFSNRLAPRKAAASISKKVMRQATGD
jgi:short-subunit dehydrogenase